MNQPRPIATDRDTEIRCACSRLLARWVSGGLELRCPRCKTAVVLSRQALDAAGETGVLVEPHAAHPHRAQ